MRAPQSMWMMTLGVTQVSTPTAHHTSRPQLSQLHSERRLLSDQSPLVKRFGTLHFPCSRWLDRVCPAIKPGVTRDIDEVARGVVGGTSLGTMSDNSSNLTTVIDLLFQPSISFIHDLALNRSACRHAAPHHQQPRPGQDCGRLAAGVGDGQFLHCVPNVGRARRAEPSLCVACDTSCSLSPCRAKAYIADMLTRGDTKQ